MYKFIICLFVLLTAFYMTSCDRNTDTDDQMDNLSGTLTSYDFTQSCFGCSSFLVYKQDNIQHASISVFGMRDQLNLSTETVTIPLPNDGLDVQVNEFDGPIGSYFCDDVLGDEAEILATHRPISGHAEITITADSIFVSDYSVHYDITVKLTDLEFVTPDSDQVEVIEELLFEEVRVGWFPG